MRGLQHGLLQTETDQYFSRVGITNRALSLGVGYFKAFVGFGLNIQSGATGTD
ncbi:hypothetical protein D3C79_1071050 [compost metagenome]